MSRFCIKRWRLVAMKRPPRLARAGAAKLLTARLREGNAVVAHQGHGPVARQSPAQQGGIGTEADARERQNVAFHRAPGPERGRTADLPVHVLRLSAADQVDGTGDRES